MKVVEESKNYAVVEYPPEDVSTRKDALNLMEAVRALGLKPLHRLEGQYQNSFVCETSSL